MPEAKLYALHGPGFSLVLEETADKQVVWRHWGAPVDTFGLPALQGIRARATFSMDREAPLSIMPTGGLGWFGTAGLRCCRSGAPIVLRLAASRVEQRQDELDILLCDIGAGVEVRVRMTVQGDCVRIATALVNRSEEPLALGWLASAVLPIPPQGRNIVSFTGRHEGEFEERSEPMPAQVWLRETRQGLTGHGGPPGLFVLGECAGWHSGEVWAVQLAWSGDHRMLLEPDGSGEWVLLLGAAPDEPDMFHLAPGQRVEAPEVLASFSTRGRNGAIADFHAAIRANVSWPGGAMAPRPVHFNSWESVYFDHDETRTLELVESAAQLGVERFVLDDGWFAGRESDQAGLGDWRPDPRRYPNGLAPIAERVVELGMEFGLWIEPEMVSRDSDLYRAHPDWVLGSGLDNALPEARHQLVLDLTRAEVREHLFEQLAGVLRSLPISYLKWDHNRAIAPAPADLGLCRHAQLQGTWALWDRLREGFPDVEMEACAAGGGRIDVGFAARAHRFWTSDNIDALSRIPIQRGFLQFMPPEMMGAHVGASPAHATGRTQSLDFRAMIALPGHFGVELNPEALSADERERLVRWIGRYKALRNRLHAGPCRLGDGHDGLTWQAHGDQDAMLLLVIRAKPAVGRRECPLRLPMVSGDGLLRVRLIDHCGVPRDRQPALLDDYLGSGVCLSGSWIAAHGLPLPRMGAEGALLFEITRV